MNAITTLPKEVDPSFRICGPGGKETFDLDYLGIVRQDRLEPEALGALCDWNELPPEVQKRRKDFFWAYLVGLVRHHQENPDRYIWPVSTAPHITARMTHAFANGIPAEVTGYGVKAACKEFGIEPKPAKIRDYLNGGEEYRPLRKKAEKPVTTVLEAVAAVQAPRPNVVVLVLETPEDVKNLLHCVKQAKESDGTMGRLYCGIVSAILKRSLSVTTNAICSAD